MNRFILFSFFIILIFLPFSVFAQNAIVPCQGVDCGWPELIQLSVNLMNFLIAIAIPLSAIAFAYAGFLYITAAGSEERIKKAHGIFWKVGLGLILVLAAWLIVWLFGTLLSSGYTIFPGQSSG